MPPSGMFSWCKGPSICYHAVLIYPRYTSSCNDVKEKYNWTDGNHLITEGAGKSGCDRSEKPANWNMGLVWNAVASRMLA